MLVLSKYVSFEETIKGSRFLSELIPCSSQAEARNLLKEQKAKYADSTHVVHAFIVGNGAEILGMSDDGEPSGTAGRPALDVLKGSGCTNVLLTITRWFGGTLLGTGGLVKAYSGGAKQVIEAANQQNAFEEYIEKSEFLFTAEYSLLKLIELKLENFHIWDLEKDFGTEVTLHGLIQADEKEKLGALLRELSNGKINI